MVTINSGTPEPSFRFQDTPKDKWSLLLIAKRSFLATRLNYDCRCLIQFCEEAELVYNELGFESAEDMIREGYELEPSKVELAVAWLRANGTGEAVGVGGGCQGGEPVSRKVAGAGISTLPLMLII
jgi:hypothetical protein